MDDFISISLLSLAMLVGCYVAGIIPLAVNFSEERLKLVTVLGAGLLCGTALAVIVPEGVHALYEDILEGKHHQASETQNVIASDKAEMSAVHEHEHSHNHTQLHAYIGVSLVLGFVFMLLVDQIGNSHVHASEDPETGRPSSSKITTTLGLVVHAAADGVALGAAASTSQTSVQLIVFVAIMLHKAPAAFGLVSFLMHAGLERNRIRKHLLVFALAAPVMSMVTYLGLIKKPFQRSMPPEWPCFSLLGHFFMLPQYTSSLRWAEWGIATSLMPLEGEASAAWRWQPWFWVASSHSSYQ
ncbi:zinc transporter ZIP9 isoform X3 [Marmota monax]|uniref:zinc transporter ZIP9 isoform X3 n=1 Tax=Marmota monax TaxID=9995 RepID=UPI001EAFDB38|nr:zinc transporter ZIP9 isoform X3 [Marmota monax]XP_048654531.1 zinc transporter ZIP9 isoform X4 [Marmota marmota marmota]